MYWTYFDLLDQVSVWLCLMLTVVVAILPDFTLKMIDLIHVDRKIHSHVLNDMEIFERI